jgi:hypothetical protein
LRPLILGYLVYDGLRREAIETTARGAGLPRLVLPLLDRRDELPLAHARRAGDAE